MRGKMEKFTRTKYSSLEGHTVVAHTSPDEQFQLKADKAGLTLNGMFCIESEEDLQEFAKVMSDAWSDRRKLKVKLAKTISGH
jgi:hypothetical protein